MAERAHVSNGRGRMRGPGRRSRTWFATCALACALAALWVGCGMQRQPADLVVRNAHIVCLDGRGTTAQAMAVRNGRIVALGKEHEILNAYSPRETLDAAGSTVVPGLIDAHSHLLGYALSLSRVNVVGTSSWEEVVAEVQSFATHLPDTTSWIRGRGWDQNDWAQASFPDRADLDALFPNRPVALQRIDGHAVMANGAALRAAGMERVRAVPGGEMLAREDGSPSGVLIDGAADTLLARIPAPSRSEKVEALRAAQTRLLAAGLTTVTDAGLDWQDIALIDSLHATRDVCLRVVAMANPTEANFRAMEARGGWDTPRLKAQSFKFYMDGALGSRGAALLAPYDDRPGHRGLVLQDVDAYGRNLTRVRAAGFQACTHAIGDSANRLVLDAYAEVLGGTNDLRWRVEHAQVVHPADLPRFQQASVIPSIQPTHATSDMYWAGERLGRGRIRRAYAYADLKEQLGLVALGTDFPVEDIDPRKTFLAAVARQDLSRTPEQGYHLDQGLTPREAMLGMTLWAAIASRMEGEVGSLEPGKRADFVLLDRDWLQLTDPHDVMSSRVRAVYMEGTRVHSSSLP